MSNKTYNTELFNFIENSPTQYHVVSNMAEQLYNSGFIELKEQDSWLIKAHSNYFVTRNRSSIIAFSTGNNRPCDTGIKVVGAHTDSPCLKVKPLPEIEINGMIRLGVEVYGGAILSSWLDRGLNLAGRITAFACNDNHNHDKNYALYTLLINYNAPVAAIPSLAIHLDRDTNTKRAVNPQIDMPPLLGLSDLKKININSKISFKNILHKQLIKEYPSINIKELLDFDMSFSDAQPPFLTGINQEMISSPRLDNLLSCHAALKSIIHTVTTNNKNSMPCMVVCTDHEEVGSDSAAGARGSFLNSVLSRLIPDVENRIRACAKSFMISLDNAHALHPAHCDRHDSSHTPLLNHGPVLKINASQRYASDCESSALFHYICKLNDIPTQTFVMRSDMQCGSTIGPSIASSTGIKTVDIGAPTLGMHSIREITGSDDPFMIFQVINQFFSIEPLPNFITYLR